MNRCEKEIFSVFVLKKIYHIGIAVGLENIEAIVDNKSF